jgi:soluble lytic murein transglycosylase-like protein
VRRRETQTHTDTERRTRPATMAGRDEFRGLLRNRAVQGLLVLVAGMQVVATQQEARMEAPPRTVALAPMVVTPPQHEVAAAWRMRALERESDRLAARYRAEGYPLTQELAREIHQAAVEYEIDPELAFGLVRAESAFRNSATSPVGAVGLTQLMPRTASWLKPGVTRRELRNPETNLQIGFMYLRRLIDKYGGDENLALLAYNRGPGTVDRALKRGRNPDNGYADFVRGKKDHGHKLFTE